MTRSSPDIDAQIAKIDQILVEEFELDPSDIRPEATLREDLDLDSLDGMDLIVAIERELGVRVDEKALMKLETVGEVQALLRAQLESADPSSE